MAQIPRYFIQDLLSRIDIIDVISPRVALKKKGANYLGLCPFHQEKSPSFTVSTNKQFYHCFGCGQHGNAIGFLMELDHFNFPEAIEELARRLGIEVPREGETKTVQVNYDAVYAVMNQASTFYQNVLRTHPLKDRVIHYLKQRGLTGTTAKEFGLGWSPKEWDSLSTQFSKQTPQLIQAGLVSQGEAGKLYDRFRDRILFPIRDKRGRVIGFGGRIIDQGEPKYLNSPETPIFQKGRTLYGLYEARKRFRKLPKVIVVEGYMDVVMLSQAGIHYAVATLGTATTPEHLRLLKQETSDIIFCFDGDRAGREAAIRALKVSLPFMTGESEIRFLFLPEGEDPDSLVQKEGKIGFEKRLTESSLSLFDWMIQQLDEGLNLQTPTGKSRWLLGFKPFYDAFPEGPYKVFVLDAAAKRLGFNTEQLLLQLQDASSSSFQQTRFSPSDALSLLDKALALLIQHPHLAHQFPPDRFVLLPELHALIQLILSQSLQHAAHVIEAYRDQPEAERFTALAFHPYPDLLEQIEKEWEDLLIKLTQDQDLSLETLIQLSRERPLTPTEKSTLLTLLQKTTVR